MNTLGLKDMHPMQLRSLLNLVELALEVAAATGEREAVKDVEEAADDLIRLFGGNGVRENLAKLMLS